MLKLRRVCVPLSMDCNLHCRYCYRAKERPAFIPAFSEDMKTYLRQLSPDWCEAVIASGGEPLMHWDKVQELFSYVPQNVHKKIMSNCSLLTQEMVDYININNIELNISHDGKQTSFLRGVDVLSSSKLLGLLQQVKYIRCFCVVTKYNYDVWENFFDTVSRLGRTDIFYAAFPMGDIPVQYDLIADFPYEKWFETWAQFNVSKYAYHLPWYDGKTLKNHKSSSLRPAGFNILPDGTVCGMVRICSTYGSIHSKDYAACYDIFKRSGGFAYCEKVKCPYIDTCDFSPQFASEHICRCRRMVMEKFTPDYISLLREYVASHLSEIEARYGFNS